VSRAASALAAAVAVLALGPRAGAEADAVAVAPWGGAEPGLAERGGAAASRVAELLGDRLPERAVLGPWEAALAGLERDASAAAVRRSAAAVGADEVLVGRVLPGTDGLRVDAELRSGHSGGALARFRASASGPDAAAEVAETLASAVLREVGGAAAGPADVAAAPPGASEAAEEASGGEAAEGPFGLGDARGDQPIRIRSDELEWIQPESGGRHIIFRRDVVVEQADITLRSDELEAFYPQDSSSPERLVATGHVRVSQGPRRARCDRAVYERARQEVLCVGSAELVQECDRVRGEEIRFDLERERVRVTGAPSVVLWPEEQRPEDPCGEEPS